jgi:hypothetical protein
MEATGSSETTVKGVTSKKTKLHGHRREKPGISNLI